MRLRTTVKVPTAETDEVFMNPNHAFEADVAAIRADLHRLRSETELIHKKTTEMWLGFIERKARLKVLSVLFGYLLVCVWIASFIFAIAPTRH
jgi:hypothetical protein